MIISPFSELCTCGARKTLFTQLVGRSFELPPFTFRGLVFVIIPPILREMFSEGISKGLQLKLHSRCFEATCELMNIRWKMGASTLHQKVEDPPFIQNVEQSEIEVKVLSPLPILPFDEAKPFGRLAFLFEGHLVMLGKVLSVESME